MKVENEEYLDTVRAQTRCECCGRSVPGCEPHHVLAKGMGGGGRMDIPPNVIGLCHLCHQLHHDGNLSRETFLIIIGKRLKMEPADVLQECYRVRRLPKGSVHGYEIIPGVREEIGGDGSIVF